MPQALLLLFFCSCSLAAFGAECETILVEKSEGNAIVVRASGEKEELAPEDSLEKGDALATGKDAWADLRLCDGSGLRVGERSKFKFEDAGEPGFVSWAFELIRGSVLGVIQGEEKSDRVKLRVRTPSASIGVRGTEFLVESDDAGETNLHTIEGEVLMGAAAEHEDMGKLRGKDLSERYQSILKERMSRIAKGEARPRAAMMFKMAEFRQARAQVLAHRLERMGRPEAAKRVQQAMEARRERWKNSAEALKAKAGNATPGAAAGIVGGPKKEKAGRSAEETQDGFQERREHKKKELIDKLQNPQQQQHHQQQQHQQQQHQQQQHQQQQQQQRLHQQQQQQHHLPQAPKLPGGGGGGGGGIKNPFKRR